MTRFHRLGRDYLESRVAAQRLVATYFPFVQFLAGGRRRDRARRRRRAGRVRTPDLRRADRLHPLHRPVLLADPAAVAGLRLLAADAGLGRPDRRADAARDADPGAGAARATRAGCTARSRCDNVRFSYPAAISRPGLERRPRVRSAAGPADPRMLGSRRRDWPQAARGAARHRPAHRRRRDGRARRRDRRRQVDGDEAAGPLLRPRRGQRRASTATTCARSTCRPSAASSATCRRRRSCSPGRSATTSPTAGPRRATPTSRPRPGRSARTTSSPRCPAATTTSCPSGAGRCRPASAS